MLLKRLLLFGVIPVIELVLLLFDDVFVRRKIFLIGSWSLLLMLPTGFQRALVV